MEVALGAETRALTWQGQPQRGAVSPGLSRLPVWRPRVTEGREGGRGSANGRDSWELHRQGAARPLRQEEPRSWVGGPWAGREGDTHL